MIFEQATWLTLAAGLLLIVIVTCWFFWRRSRDKVNDLSEIPTLRCGEETAHQVPSGRMRKRDIVRYYGRRMIKKAGVELGHLRKRPRERVYNMAKRLLQGPDIPERQLYREPPEAFLEADYLEGDSNIPSEVMYLLRSVRAFGHFEKPLFMELCKHVQTKFVPSGALLFGPGFIDDSIYVVRNGRLKVFIIEPYVMLNKDGVGTLVTDNYGRVCALLPPADGAELPLKEAGPGDSVHSMLSILDVVTGHTKPFTTVAAKALRDSYVLQISGEAFKNFFEDNPDSLLRLVQIVMLRLQRVTFLALNQVLGLGKELLNQKPTLPSGDCNVSKIKHLVQQGTSLDQVLDLGKELLNQKPTLPSGDCNVSKMKLLVQQDTSVKLLPSREDSLSPEHQQQRMPHGIIRRFSLDSSDDSTSSASIKHKMVAIDTTQNEHFTHRLLPSQSPEFDNVIDQARVDRQEFSSDGALHQEPSSAHCSSVVANSIFPHLCHSDMLKAAMQDLVKVLQLKDESLLKGRTQFIEVPVDSLLGLEGDLDSCVYFIATGRLKVFRQTNEANLSTNPQDLLYVAHPGELCGVLSALTGEPSFFTISAGQDSCLVTITKTNLYYIMSACPQAVCGLACGLVQRLSSIVRQMDFALDWMELEAGRALYRQGDEANAAFIILNGRVRSVVRKSEGKKELVDEYGRGETIGLVEMMTNSACATTVHAIRDTEVACLPSGLLSTIKLKQPQVISRLIQVLGERILGSCNRNIASLSSPVLTGDHSEGLPETKKHMVSNLSTVAVVPITRDVPLTNFTKYLCAAINVIAPSVRLTSQVVQKELGSSALESIHEYRLRTWLGRQEDTHRIVLYEADADVSPWTARCIRQADCILLVGLAEKTPSESMTHIVKQVELISMRVQKELVLLHKETVLHPVGTVKWLNALGWISSYFHVRCPNSFFSPEILDMGEVDKFSDCARLARRLTGSSVGLVLGGGGARGIAHVGALRALAEAGVPIDMVAGTSIGAFVGALYCEERNFRNVEKRAGEWAKGMASLWNQMLDLTYPSTSMFTGRSFNTSIHNVFGEKHIEDLWIPYFCVTTDITESKMRVHTSGSLWRYIRASMSLSGYLPPLCDPVDGHLLLDGGYVNNLPADVISVHGAETIIAIDVGALDNNDMTNYGDHISGWYLLWKKLNPFATKIRVPNLTEIQSRLAYVSCIRQLEMVKAKGMCEYIRLPIDSIGTLQFGSFETIVPIGYLHCKKLVSSWHRNQKMKHLVSTQNEEVKKHLHMMKKKFDQMCLQNSNSVRNLVTLAAQISIPQQEDDVSGYWSNPEDQIFKIGENGEYGITESVAPAMVTVSDSELT